MFFLFIFALLPSFIFVGWRSNPEFTYTKHVFYHWALSQAFYSFQFYFFMVRGLNLCKVISYILSFCYFIFIQVITKLPRLAPNLRSSCLSFLCS